MVAMNSEKSETEEGVGLSLPLSAGREKKALIQPFAHAVTGTVHGLL